MTPTIVDTIVVIVIALSTILAWSRGITREALSVLGWIVAVLIARQFASVAVPLIDQIPQVAQYIKDCQIKTGMGFVILFIVAMIVMAIVTPLFSSMVQNSFLSAFDSGLGALFGFVRGALIIMLALFVYTSYVQPSSPFSMIDESRSYALLSPSQDAIANDVASETTGIQNWLTNQFAYITRECPVIDTSSPAQDG